MRSRQRILIIGGGIAGASLAYELSHRHTVTILEAESSLGYHSTGRSAAMYLASYGNALVRDLTRLSRLFLEVPPPGFVDGPILKTRPLLSIARRGEGHCLDEPQYDGQRRLSGAEAIDIVPILRDTEIVAASLDPTAAEIDADRLHQAYVRGARKLGAALYVDTRVEGAERRGGQWCVRTNKEDFTADIVVNAAGAWADHIARNFGVEPVGLQSLRRTLILVQPPEDWTGKDWPMVMTALEDLYFKPDAGLLLISPAEEIPALPADVQAEEIDVAIGIDRFQSLCTMPVHRVTHSWAGLRTFAADRSPVVGYDPGTPGFFWFAGQGGFGLQMAPALARWGAALLDKERFRGLSDGLDETQVAPGRSRKNEAAVGQAVLVP